MASNPLGRRSPLDEHVLQFADLQTLSGKSRLVAVEQWAQSQGIAYKYDAKGGIWTTVAALNAALGLGASTDAHWYPPDLIV